MKDFIPISGTCGSTVTLHFANGGLYSAPLRKGSRVRIKAGYLNEGKVGFYVAKSLDEAGKVLVRFGSTEVPVLADAIYAFPYTRAELAKREAKRIAKKHGLSKKATRAVVKSLFGTKWTEQPA